MISLLFEIGYLGSLGRKLESLRAFNESIAGATGSVLSRAPYPEDSPVTARIRFAGGARASEGRGVALTHSDMRARNTFQNTDEVRPASLPVKIGNDGVVVVIPKQAVAAVGIQLA